MHVVVAEQCTGCELCVPYCPMGAIRMNGIAIIDEDECVECGVCRRSRVCPTDSFHQPTLAWPRQIRAMLSDQTYRAPGAPPRSSGERKTKPSPSAAAFSRALTSSSTLMPIVVEPMADPPCSLGYTSTIS